MFSLKDKVNTVLGVEPKAGMTGSWEGGQERWENPCGPLRSEPIPETKAVRIQKLFVHQARLWLRMNPLQ